MGPVSGEIEAPGQAARCGAPAPDGVLCSYTPRHSPVPHSWQPRSPALMLWKAIHGERDKRRTGPAFKWPDGTRLELTTWAWQLVYSDAMSLRLMSGPPDAGLAQLLGVPEVRVNDRLASGWWFRLVVVTEDVLVEGSLDIR